MVQPSRVALEEEVGDHKGEWAKQQEVKKGSEENWHLCVRLPKEYAHVDAHDQPCKHCMCWELDTGLGSWGMT